jgi:glyoxylase-like metal-dependent hydrolase (beta-lactamase superfamily II)
MLRNVLRVTIAGVASVWLAAVTASASTQKIGDGLYAYISSNDSSSNSVFLVGENGILVVDTGVNAEEGGKLLAEIRKISQLPVRWIVNTHYHPDHRAGNSAVGPDAVIIISSFTRDKVLAGARQGGQDYSLNEIADKAGITLYLNGHPVRIYAPGPAHTRGDLLVYFPDQHAIATGDLFLNSSCPYMDDGDLENWIRALDEMLALPIEHAVPGHFAVAGTAELRHFRDYLADLQKQVSRMHDQGLSLKVVQQGLKLDAYRDLRQFPQFEATFGDNAAAYFHQLEAHDRSRSGANK